MMLFPSFLKKRVGLYAIICTVLFLESCEKKVTEISVNYSEEKATSVSYYPDHGNKGFDIYLKGNATTPVLGEFQFKNDTTIFTPVIPFEAGRTYELARGKELAREFTIAKMKAPTIPELLAVYPTGDTVPQNLLKMYFVFNQPMQEVGKALDYVKVTQMSTGKKVSVFLDLPTELWNKDHTQLTLWLDPGRIKTGLIPNKEQGLPLIEGESYEIEVSPDWKSATGVQLKTPLVKKIWVAKGDHTKPILSSWGFGLPTVGTNEPLVIEFKEPMDAGIDQDVLFISKVDGATIDGKYELSKNENLLHFTPTSPWTAGAYSLIATRYLEDLAGNTPVHLFDTELRDSEDMKHEKYIDSRQFTID